MDTQLKRGILEICVLKALQKEDSYGYRIIKDLSPAVTLSESTLYPVLRRLEAQNALTVYSMEHNGRLRKYYAITDAGKEKIEAFLKEWEAVMKVYDFIRREENDA